MALNVAVLAAAVRTTVYRVPLLGADSVDANSDGYDLELQNALLFVSSYMLLHNEH